MTTPAPPPAPAPALPPGSGPPAFEIDAAALERRYKLLQWSLHPDKAAARSEQERGLSAEAAARINQAYGVLRRPLSRANYLVGPGVRRGGGWGGVGAGVGQPPRGPGRVHGNRTLPAPAGALRPT